MRYIRPLIKPKRLSPDEVELLIERIAGSMDRTDVVLLYLHGSHARGHQSALSDIDFAALLNGNKAKDRDAHLHLLEALQKTCGREDVDLVVLNTAGPIIKDRVVRYGRLVLARSERDRILFEAGAIKEALDFRYYSRIYDDALFTQIAEGRYLG